MDFTYGNCHFSGVGFFGGHAGWTLRKVIATFLQWAFFGGHTGWSLCKVVATFMEWAFLEATLGGRYVMGGRNFT